MKSYEEFWKIFDNCSEEYADKIFDAWYDDRATCCELLRKIGLTIEEYEYYRYEYSASIPADFEEEEEEDEDFEEVEEFEFSISDEEANALMNGDYIDALSFFASILVTEHDQESALMTIDEVMWEKVENKEMWLRVYSALRCGIN